MWKGRCGMVMRDSLILMPEDVRRAIYEEIDHDFSAEICTGAAIHDLTLDAIETFRKTWIENSGNARIATLSTEQLLRDCNAVTDKGVTYAALILFGKRSALLEYLPHAEIRFEYRSSEAAGPAAQREDFLCGFFDSFDRIWDLINLRNDHQHYQNGFFVHPVPTFNEKVVREGILNAVSHRDYKMGGNIFVRQYNNRIVIENPGGFPRGITIENILDRNSARNARIANIFQLCGLVERAGQGINLIYEQSIKEAKPLPDFHGSDAWFVKLTLNGKVHHPKMLSMLKKLDEEKLKSMTTDDYILLAALFCGKGLDSIHVSRFDHLVELGVVSHTELGIRPINGEIILKVKDDTVSTNDTQADTNRLPIDSPADANRLPIDSHAHKPCDCHAYEVIDRKKQIMSFIADNGKATSMQLATLTGLTQGRVRAILNELAAGGMIVKVGDYRYASYVLKKTDG